MWGTTTDSVTSGGELHEAIIGQAIDILQH